MLVLAATLLVLGVGVVGLAVVDRPRIQSVDNDWGTFTPERTEVVTRVGVESPPCSVSATASRTCETT